MLPARRGSGCGRWCCWCARRCGTRSRRSDCSMRPPRRHDVCSPSLRRCSASIATLMLPSCTEKLDRVTRADWDYLTATWNQYKAGSNWTSIGGDVDAAVPGELSYASPGAYGPYAIPGLGPYVSDAIANRGGLVL